MLALIGISQGAGGLGKNDVTRWQANSIDLKLELSRSFCTANLPLKVKAGNTKGGSITLTSCLTGLESAL
jgi:hypothetical protein